LFAQTNSVTIGSASGYSKIETDGTLEFAGDATVWEDYVVPFTSVKIRAETSPPDFAQFLNDGEDPPSTGVYGYAFSASELQEVFFTIQMPHSWAGTAIYPHIHWSPSDNTAGIVTWGIEYTWVNYSTSSKLFPATEISTTNYTVSTNQGKHHLIAKFDAITPIVDEQDGISSILVVRFFRDADNDTYAADAFALSFDIHYEKNTVGSRGEYVK